MECDNDSISRVQFLFETFGEEVVFVTKDLALRDEGLSSFPRILRNFGSLERLDISKNALTYIPVDMLRTHIPAMTSLDISDNR